MDNVKFQEACVFCLSTFALLSGQKNCILIKKSYIIYPCLYRDQHLLEIARNLEQREWLNLLKFDWLNLINKLKLDENRYETANRMYSGE
jgi:hypothetical protein